MRVIIVEDYDEMSRKAAAIVNSQVVLKPDCVLGLATGSTPLGMYRELIKLYQNQAADFSKVTTFNLDEYYGLDKENKQSYAYYMNTHFFKKINIKKENTHIPDGMSADINEACGRYEQWIAEKGGIDLMVLGIGSNGHIGFNEPDTNFVAETHRVMLKKETIQDNSRFFKSAAETPTMAISMGIRTIIQSRMLLLLASGEAKADAIYKTLKGTIRPEVPASIIQLHPNATILLDIKAAKLLLE